MINGVKIEKLRQWLKDQGADIRPATNEWEVLRFKFEGCLRVIYKRKNGSFTYDEKTNIYAKMCRDGVRPKQQHIVGHSNGWARNIIKRGFGLKALLLSATTGPERVYACCSDALPWEDCKHTTALEMA